MKKLLLLLVTLLSMTSTINAQVITGVNLTVTLNGERQTIPIPSSDFALVDLTDEITNSLVLNSIEVTTTGAISDVSISGSVYKEGSTAEWRTFPLPSQGNGVFALYNVDIEILEEGDKPATRIFEFYAMATTASNGTVYYNNNGENYKVMFTNGDSNNWNVKFYRDNTAELVLCADGKDLQYTYTGSMERDNTTQPGKVQSLRIDNFSVWFIRNDDVVINNVSLQYKVYEEGTSGNWNTLEAKLTESDDIWNPDKGRTDHYMRYSGSPIIELTEGLIPERNYVLEIAYQVVDGNNNYVMFGKDNANSRFYFSTSESVEPTTTVTIVGAFYSHSTWAEMTELSQAVFGSPWNIENTANDMTFNGLVYTLPKSNVIIKENCRLSFKAAVNRSWDECYGRKGNSETGSEYDIYLTNSANPENGEIVGDVYDINFYFDLPNKDAYAEIIFKGTTGINGLVSASKGKGDIYDIMGRKVPKVRKGIYVRDGKKIVVR